MCVVDVSAQGVKEVTLLGQNVNSYRDTSEEQFCGSDLTQLSRGFKTVYRTKQGGLRFSDLLDRVSCIDPDMRIRFTSPHPKDFPDEVHDTLHSLLNKAVKHAHPCFSCLKWGWLSLPDLLCVLVFAGFASDCGAKEYLSADPPSSPEWKQQDPESNAPWVRQHSAFFFFFGKVSHPS